MSSTNNLPRGMGAGTPRQEIERWLREAGKITVHDEGEQAQLFAAEPVRMFRLWNKAGESILITQATAEAYGLRPTAPVTRHRSAQSTLYEPQSDTLF